VPDGLAWDDVGAGEVVVYLHGAPDSRLARGGPVDGVRLLAVDRPGYGGSAPQRWPPDLRGFGRELGRLLDRLGVERCALAAWSAGAPWAFGAAAVLGARVSRVTTYGAVRAVDLDVGDVDAAAAMLLPPPPVSIEEAREHVGEPAGEVLAAALVEAVARHGDAGLRADLFVQATRAVDAVLPDVRCPVLLVHGDADPLSDLSYADDLAEVRIERWPGAGHRHLLLEWERWITASR
jgi:pimeloyl-ACP methyl ester carboxylesterase